MIIFSFNVLAATYIYYGRGAISTWNQISTGGLDLKYSGSLSASMQAWNNKTLNVGTINFFYNSNGSNSVKSANASDSWYGLYTPQGYQFLFFGRCNSFQITINNRIVPNNNNFRQSVFVHELGHALCLDDNPSSGNASIMNYDRDRYTLINPTSNDVAGVNYAYN